MINNANNGWHGDCYESFHSFTNGVDAETTMAAIPEVLWLDPLAKLDSIARLQLRDAGMHVQPVTTLEELRAGFNRCRLVVLRLRDDTGLLREVRGLLAEAALDIPVICRVDRDRLETAVMAMRDGASHVIGAEDWGRAIWAEALALVAPPKPKAQTFVFADPVSQKLLALAQRVAQAEVTALLTGPTGAGKEVLARILHEASPRRSGPFVGLNCAAMPESMIEDMLFGHEKGAFTGALRDHQGLFEQACGGTLFLDEIGEMPVRLQAKLLRVLQERQLTRLGGQQMISVDFRLVAATNRDLKAAIDAREFREDLYFRISTFALRLPRLAERPLDILPLAQLMLQMHGASRHPWIITPQAQAQLLAHDWPGNVRELANVMQRAIVLSTDALIDSEQLIFDEFGSSLAAVAGSIPAGALANRTADSGAAQPEVVPPESAADLDAAVRLSEHRAIAAALRAAPSRAEAARALGISPRTLRYKLAQLKGYGLGVGTAEMASS